MCITSVLQESSFSQFSSVHYLSYSNRTGRCELSKKKFPGSKNNLNALCRRFGISLEEREKHSAITDCFLLLQVFQELNGGKQGNLELSIYEEIINIPNKVKYENLNLPKVKISDEELENHKKMLKEIPNNFW